MGLRETLNEKPGIALGAAGGVIVLALFFIIRSFMGDGPSTGGSGNVAKAWFTVDDGKTWFSDDEKNIPPYDKDGKQAVRAYIFVKEGGKPYCGYLERYTPDGKKRREEMLKNPEKVDIVVAETTMFTDREVKKPGEKDWVKQNTPKAAEVTNVQGDYVSP